MVEGGSRRVQERAVELVEGGGWREVARSLGVGCVCRRIQVGRKVVPSCEMQVYLKMNIMLSELCREGGVCTDVLTPRHARGGCELGIR